MKKVKASELTGKALDWAVAQAEGNVRLQYDSREGLVISNVLGWIAYRPSVAWAQGGPIIEASFSKLEIGHEGDVFSDQHDKWYAESCDGSTNVFVEGPTALVAAMRCYVVCRLGNEVEIPEELL